MSPAQENQVGAQEHEKILKQYGIYNHSDLQNYIEEVGQKVVADTERPDVDYKFFLLDDPIINAFALPGGYIYLTRGLMALSNSEAEIAAVLAHEAGHITGRHSAARYSRGVATTLGATILSAVVGSSDVSRALGVGTDLYLKSYSRAQESESDALGIRYMTRAGYDPYGMANFLSNLQADKVLDNKVNNRSEAFGSSYLSTHPATDQRVQYAQQEALKYPAVGVVNKGGYLKRIDGITYGSSAAQGFIRGQNFYHTEIGFKFSVPEGYSLINQSNKVLGVAKNGGMIVFDIVPNKERISLESFVRNVWLKDAPVHHVQNFTNNGMAGATALSQANIQGQDRDLRVVAFAWTPTQIVRFLFIMPSSYNSVVDEAYRRSAYSFARLSDSEKAGIKPQRIRVVKARVNDNVARMAARMAMDDFKEDRFRVLNGLAVREEVVPGELYKIVVQD